MEWKKHYRITLSVQPFETRIGVMFDWDEFWIADNGDYRVSELGTSQMGPVPLYGGFLLPATPRVEQQLSQLQTAAEAAAVRLQRLVKKTKGLAAVLAAFRDLGK